MKIRKCNGFSMLEMLVVCVLVGVAAAVAVPSFMSYRQNSNLREAARALSSDIAFYRQRTITENRRYLIILDKNANSYKVQIETPPAGSGAYADLVPAVTKSPGDISNQVIISDVTFPGQMIYIQPRGTISPAGAVTLQHTGSSRNALITANIMGRVNVTYP